MPQFTAFLELTLPELNEFVNSWHQPTNQNFEELDDWLKGLYDNLVGSGSGSTWSTLRGSMDSLAERLDVAIGPDGTVNLSGSGELADMSSSVTRGGFSGPRDRLNAGDVEVYAAGQPFAGSRFVAVPAAGPSAAFPPEQLDPGMAFRTADFGATTGKPFSSPAVPWAPGLVSGGASPFVSGVGIGQVRISADTPPAVFNIDGYIFRLREVIDFDWNLADGGSPPAHEDYVWLYVSRNEADYNTSNFRYTAPSGPAVAAKDLRKLQSGSGTGVCSGATFSATGATFNTAAFGKVKAGDLLVITSGGAAGTYVIDELDGTTPDTKLTIRNSFIEDGTGASWYVLDNAHPNIGCEVTDGDPTTQPPFAAGRVYFARARHNDSGNPTDIVTFAKGGVYDSGWVTVDAAADFPKTLVHNLGVVPSSVDIWVRTGATARIYRPLVRRQIVTDVDEGNTTLDSGDTKTTTFIVPSLYEHISEIDITMALMNASTDPAKAAALFTDSGGTDRTVGQIRVVARR